MKIIRFFVLINILISFLIPVGSVQAQNSAGGPTYVIQPGDTLNSIAVRFDVAVQDLIDANQLANPDILSTGMELVIPGLQGVTGKLITEPVPLGETLATLSRRYSISLDMLVRLNRITSPVETYAGSSMILPQGEDNPVKNGRMTLDSGQTMLEAAAANNLNPWALAQENFHSNLTRSVSGEALYYDAPESQQSTSAIPGVSSLIVEKLPLVQGKTQEIRVTTHQPMTLTGSLAGRELHFLPLLGEANTYVALQGVPALARPGLASFVLQGSAENGEKFAFEQMVLLQAGGYAQDPPLFVDPTTIDPTSTKPEDDLVKEKTSPVTPTRYWDGVFRIPVDEPVCIKSWYGNRRSYNGSDFDYFHTGVDYGVCANLNIYAPAAGVVVLAEAMTVRGNATIIDHGWGVYSGIWHQSELKVKVGDRVEAGQLIGLIGGTGRVTGPHLHWEIFVNGVQVEPLDWYDITFP